MSEFERAVALCLTAENEEERKQATQKLRELISAEPRPVHKDLETDIRWVLAEIGVKDNLRGHKYLVHALKLVIEDERYLECITAGLYPAVAKEFDVSWTRVERGIRCAIETAVDRADWDVLHKYFGNTISPNKGKPTNVEFLSRISNVIRQGMKEG